MKILAKIYDNRITLYDCGRKPNPIIVHIGGMVRYIEKYPESNEWGIQMDNENNFVFVDLIQKGD